mgnify:CR=1 FL=1
MVKSKKMRVYQAVINVILILVTLTIVVPLILLFISSISSEKSLIANGYSFFPSEFSLEGYRYIWQNKGTVLRAYGMTIVVTAIGTVINVLLSAMMAYALSNTKLLFRRVINFFIFFTMIFSGGLVPAYIMWTSTFHIKNTIFALLVPNLLLSPMNVILIRTYMMTSVPSALYEAAQIDGGGHRVCFLNVALPLSKPILVTMGLFAGLAYWNDWTNGLYYLTDPKLYSVQVLLNKMIQDIQAIQANSVAAAAGTAMTVPQFSIRMAIAFVALLPILIIYPFLQKYFAEGIALGSVKG